MKRIVSLFEHAIDIISGAFAAWLVVALMVMILVEVTARYVFSAPLGVADLMGALTLTAIVFLGLAYTWREKGHIRILFVFDRLPPKVKDRLRLVTLIVAAGCVPVFIYAGYYVVKTSLTLGLKTEHFIRVPAAWPQLVIPVGFVMLLVVMIVDLVKAIAALTRKEAR